MSYTLCLYLSLSHIHTHTHSHIISSAAQNLYTILYNHHKVLRSHERNPDRSSSEKVFRKRLGRRSLCSTRFDRTIEQPGKKFFLTSDKPAKPEQVPRQPNLHTQSQLPGNRDTSKPISAHSKSRPTKLSERIRRLAGMSRSITSALRSKF